MKTFVPVVCALVLIGSSLAQARPTRHRVVVRDHRHDTWTGPRRAEQDLRDLRSAIAMLDATLGDANSPLSAGLRMVQATIDSDLDYCRERPGVCDFHRQATTKRICSDAKEFVTPSLRALHKKVALALAIDPSRGQLVGNEYVDRRIRMMRAKIKRAEEINGVIDSVDAQAGIACLDYKFGRSQLAVLDGKIEGLQGRDLAELRSLLASLERHVADR